MKLSEILSVSGAPGLFKYVAQSKGGIIVETVGAVQKRSIVSASAKVSALGDIAIFTDSSEVSLAEVLDNIYAALEGKPAAITGKSTPEELASFMGAALAEYDRERVHNSDIKKVAQWYNLLLAAGMTKFQEEEEEGAEASEAVKAATQAKSAVKKTAAAVNTKAGAASKSKVTATKSTTARKAP